MLVKRTNIETQLTKLRNREISQERLLEDVYALLNFTSKQEDRIEQELSGNSATGHTRFNFDLLDTHNIYHINQIKKICINYRLRFLESTYFKGEVPTEAIKEIKRLEALHGTKLKGFKIIAPSKLFRLKDKDDPLLFATLGNDYYYLIYKWGNDLHPLRKVLVWPFKNIVNLTLLVVLISYLITLGVPDGLFSKSGSSAEFWIIFFFMFKCIASIVIFYGFALGKNFNPAIWRSKFFN